MKTFDETQHAELDSWFSKDPKINRDKRIREVIRYPLLKKQMGLDYLDTNDMIVWDIGAGPFGGVSSIIKCKVAIRYDPLSKEYKKYYPLFNYGSERAEELDYGQPDLVISTNAIDHCESPIDMLVKLRDTMRPGTYFAHLHAIDNAYSHPHEAHAHNINPELVKQVLWDDFELVWNLDYEHDGLVYSWRKQPAFAQLWRKSRYE